MTHPSITIGSDKQIAYAKSIFERKGDFIREQRADFARQFTAFASDLQDHVGDTIPNTDTVVTREMVERAERMISDFSGGAESHAVYWIEDVPARDHFDRYVMTGDASEKMSRMGLGV